MRYSSIIVNVCVFFHFDASHVMNAPFVSLQRTLLFVSPPIRRNLSFALFAHRPEWMKRPSTFPPDASSFGFVGSRRSTMFPLEPHAYVQSRTQLFVCCPAPGSIDRVRMLLLSSTSK